MKPAWSTKSKSFARHPLGDALEGVLSGLVALEARVQLNPLLATLSGARAQGEAQSSRLREVLDRDRALVAAGAALRVAPRPVEPPDAERELVSVAAAASPPEPKPSPPPPNHSAAVGGVEARGSAHEQDHEPVTCDEPIRTRTMARLLAAQGHKQRALSIYNVLLASDHDPELRAEAERLRAQQA
jgi:hypothetical protein